MSRSMPGSGSNYLETSGSPSVLNIVSANGPYSMAAWVNIANTNSDITVVSKYNGSFGPILRIISKKIRFFTVDSGLAGQEAIGATSLTPGTWQLVGGAWNGSSTMRVILDGTQDGTDTMGTQHGSSASNWRIADRPSGSFDFNGIIYCVALWASYLSDTDWADLAAGDCPDTVDAANLVGFWILEGNSPENDQSGNGNNMVVTGTTFDASEPTTTCGATPTPPVNDVAPVVTGTTKRLYTLSTTDGTWTGADTFTYQWQTSVNGISGWTNISGETTSFLALTDDEVGLYVRCEVTGHNDDGDTAANSNVVGPIDDFSPVARFSVIG